MVTWIYSGEHIDIIFLDLQKAFDKVPHRRLMAKVRAIGIKGKLANWIQEWLKGRRQSVVLNGELSDWEDIVSGVPQGSVLGPILFIIFINDIDEEIRNRIWKFADDAKVVGKLEGGISSIEKDL